MGCCNTKENIKSDELDIKKNKINSKKEEQKIENHENDLKIEINNTKNKKLKRYLITFIICRSYLKFI